MSQESLRYFGSLEVRTGTDYFSAKHLSLTVLWAVYAIGVIGSGITLRSAKVRQIGMALLTIPVAKLFVFDVFLLERGYRVAAFVTLGVLLLGNGSGVSALQSVGRHGLSQRGFYERPGCESTVSPPGNGPTSERRLLMP